MYRFSCTQRGTSGLAFDTGAGRAGHLCGCGPYGSCAGGEMTQAEMDESLAAYGGTLQFTFDAAGGAKMIQGGGTLNGTYQYLDDGSVGVIFDYNGEELRYACIFTWTDEGELLMVAISDVEGADGIYFVQ